MDDNIIVASIAYQQPHTYEREELSLLALHKYYRCSIVYYSINIIYRQHSLYHIMRQQMTRCIAFTIIISTIHGFSTKPTASSTRRDVLEQLKTLTITPFVATSIITLPQNANAATGDSATPVPISASWNSVDGLNSVDSKFVSFDKSAYQVRRFRHKMCFPFLQEFAQLVIISNSLSSFRKIRP